MFEPVYMSFLANRIINAIDFTDPKTGLLLPSKEIECKWVGHSVNIQLYSKDLKLKLSKKYFQEIYVKKRKGLSSELIEPKHVHQFIQTCVVGKITKRELDDERVREINQLDMMMNSRLIDHPESIVEFQIINLVLTGFIWHDYTLDNS